MLRAHKTGLCVNRRKPNISIYLFIYFLKLLSCPIPKAQYQVIYHNQNCSAVHGSYSYIKQSKKKTNVPVAFHDLLHKWTTSWNGAYLQSKSIVNHDFKNILEYELQQVKHNTTHAIKWRIIQLLKSKRDPLTLHKKQNCRTILQRHPINVMFDN